MKSVHRIFCVAAFALLGPCVAFAQQPPVPTTPKQQTQTQTAKKPVVWTDDNISSVRSSSDIYQMEQEKKGETEQTAAPNPVAPVAGSPQNGRPVPRAKTVQEADDLIASDQQKIESQKGRIQETEKALATAPDSYKARLNWRIQSYTHVINEIQTEISAIRKEKDALAKGAQPGSNPNSAAQPPSQ